MAASERLKQVGKQHRHLATVPIGQPDPIPKRTLVQARRPWQRTDRRELTAAEIAEQDLKLRERQDKKQRPNTPGSPNRKKEMESQIPATPERKPLASTAPG